MTGSRWPMLRPNAGNWRNVFAVAMKHGSDMFQADGSPKHGEIRVSFHSGASPMKNQSILVYKAIPSGNLT